MNSTLQRYTQFRQIVGIFGHILEHQLVYMYENFVGQRLPFKERVNFLVMLYKQLDKEEIVYQPKLRVPAQTKLDWHFLNYRYFNFLPNFRKKFPYVKKYPNINDNELYLGYPEHDFDIGLLYLSEAGHRAVPNAYHNISYKYKGLYVLHDLLYLNTVLVTMLCQFKKLNPALTVSQIDLRKEEWFKEENIRIEIDGKKSIFMPDAMVMDRWFIECDLDNHPIVGRGTNIFHKIKLQALYYDLTGDLKPYLFINVSETRRNNIIEKVNALKDPIIEKYSDLFYFTTFNHIKNYWITDEMMTKKERENRKERGNFFTDEIFFNLDKKATALPKIENIV